MGQWPPIGKILVDRTTATTVLPEGMAEAGRQQGLRPVDEEVKSGAS